MVVVMQQPGGGSGSTTPELVSRSIALIVATAFLNLCYAIDEIKAILPWVLKSSMVIHNFWQETSGALFPGSFKPGCSSVAGVMNCLLYCTPSALLALVIAPPFALCYSLYKYLEEDVWNAIDLIYTSLVWVSLGYHVYTIAYLYSLGYLVNRSVETAGHARGAVSSAASLAVAVVTPESLTALSTTALGVAGWSIIFVVVRLLSYFRSTRTIGPIIAMIMAIIRDMLPFLVVLVLLVAGGAFAMPLMMGVLDKTTNTEGVMAGDGFADPQRSFMTIFMWLNGDWDVAAYENHTGALVYFYSFLFIASIIMMNLLIAIMGATYGRVQGEQKVQARIVRAEIIHEIESAMYKNDKDRPCWHRCLPKWLKPWCKDDRELNPGAVLRVVKDTGTDADDGDDAEREGGRLTEMRTIISAMKAEANARFKKADARAANAEATMSAIRALLEGGGGGDGRGVGSGAVEEKRSAGGLLGAMVVCRGTSGGQEMEVAV